MNSVTQNISEECEGPNAGKCQQRGQTCGRPTSGAIWVQTLEGRGDKQEH